MALHSFQFQSSFCPFSSSPLQFSRILDRFLPIYWPISNYSESCSFWSYSMFNDSKGGFWRFSPTFWSLQWTFLFSAEKLRNCIWKKCDHDKEVVFLLWCHSAASLPPHKNFFLNEIFACLLVCQKWRNHSIEKI